MIFGFLGLLLLVMGFSDLIARYFDTDLWGFLPISLPAQIMEYAPYIAIGLGLICIFLSRSNKQPQRF